MYDIYKTFTIELNNSYKIVYNLLDDYYIFVGRRDSMITVYKHIEEELVADCTVSDATKGSWVNLVNPDPDELSLINILTEIPTDVLKTALDMEERSHVELEDNYIFVVINIPVVRGNDMYDTVPLGIFLTPDFFITVCLEESEVLYPFISNQISTFRHTTKNKDFFQLLELQKSMTYFTSALRTNGTVMERLLRLRGHSSYRHLLKMYEEDEDLLEDVIIENKQAMEMVEMYSNILMNMMNAFTSIISNNLNMVMKMLATLTITMAVPTIIFSLWGTNVHLPFQDDPDGFVKVVVISIICSAVAIFGMWKKDLF